MADRYAEWISVSPGESVTLLFDYRIFGDVVGPETGILEFLHALPSALAGVGVRAVRPSDVAKNPPHGDIGEAVGLADPGASQGHQRTILQQSALAALEKAGKLVTDTEIWRYLLDTDSHPPDGNALNRVRETVHTVSHWDSPQLLRCFHADPLALEERSAASAPSRRAVLSLRCISLSLSSPSHRMTGRLATPRIASRNSRICLSLPLMMLSAIIWNGGTSTGGSIRSWRLEACKGYPGY